ncbi:hypothetical protein HZB03_00055, partial [Candidatus Woesearchaeota archaeon]|nr:hypothetical protein [Candidatus Woesearchaeota archaeon]
MVQENSYALLLSGDENRFAEEALRFQEYLVHEAKFDPSHIGIVFCTYAGTQYLLDETQAFFTRVRGEKPKADVVVLFTGHGGKGSFFPNRSALGYRDMAQLIAEHRGGVLFLNESCYSGSSVKAFEDVPALGKRQVITSSQEDELTYGGIFLDRLVASYRWRLPFRRRTIGTVEIVGKQIVRSAQGDMPVRIEEGVE